MNDGSISSHPSLKSHWKELRRHAKRLRDIPLLELFDRDSERVSKLSLDCEGLHFDFSKIHVDAEALEALLALIDAVDVAGLRERMMRGDVVNATQESGAWHTLMRASSSDASDVVADFRRESERALEFADAVRAGSIKADDGKPYRHVIHLGVGGSELGPRLTVEALAGRSDAHAIDMRFVSNMDAHALDAALEACEPESSLIIVASKSFGTAETLDNLRGVIDWMKPRVREPMAHVIGIGADAAAARALGLKRQRTFRIPEALGGRFSLWSAINMALMIRCGSEVFRRLLNGAASMDRHFQTAPCARNAPVLAAALDVWYRDMLGAPTRAVFPYEQRLRSLPAYLQQLEMESNGKSCGRDGEPLAALGSAIVWGGVGTDMQHSVFQLMHQGEHLIPAEFLCTLQPAHSHSHRHRSLLSNCLAQSAALMSGRDAEETAARLSSADAADPERRRLLIAARNFAGNRPSSTIVLRRLEPETLGALLAFYEHRTVVCGGIWQINSFDQMGVELGKELANRFAEAIEDSRSPDGIDASTEALMRLIRDDD